jgi:hypothetical protein
MGAGALPHRHHDAVVRPPEHRNAKPQLEIAAAIIH